MESYKSKLFTFFIGFGFIISIVFRTQIFDFPIPSIVVEMLLFLVILSAGSYIFQELKLQKDGFIVLILFTLLFLFSVISSFWAAYPILTAQRTLLTFTLPIIIFYIVSLDNRRAQTFQLLSQITVVFGTMFGLIGIILYVFGDFGTAGEGTIQYIAIGPIELSQDVYGPENRISSLLGNPNTLAGFHVASIPLTLIMLRQTHRKWAYSLALIIQVTSLFLSGSRNGFVAVACGLTVILLLLNPKILMDSKNIMKAVSMALGSAMVVLIVFPVKRIFDISSAALGDAGRLEMWISIWEYFVSNPLGAGFGISREAIPGVHRSPHSDYFAIIGELGLIGLVLYSLLIGITILYGLRKYIHASTTDQLYLAGAIAVFIAFTVHGFAETTVTRGGGRQLYWSYFLAFITCYHINDKI